jgi:hypothetical protein
MNTATITPYEILRLMGDATDRVAVAMIERLRADGITDTDDVSDERWFAILSEVCEACAACAPDKSQIRNWDTVATYGSTYCSGDKTRACDVSVQVGEHNGGWFFRTTDDAGGMDDAPDTEYSIRAAAEAAAKEFAESSDECDGMSADKWEAAQADQRAAADLDPDGGYLLADEDGSPWGADRYSSEDGARRAEVAWYDGVSDANPGTDIIWHLMDCPHAARMVDGKVEILADRDDR